MGQCIVRPEDRMQSTQTPLAVLLQTVAVEVERVAEALDAIQWEAFVETEQRTVGQLIYHIAWAWEAESAAFRALASGAASSDWTQEWLDARNSEQAIASAKMSRPAIMRFYRESRDLAIAFINSLSPTDLASSGTHMPGEPERTVAGWIDACLIGHPREHLAEIQATVKSSS
jgi:hypothetical protein